LRRWPQESAFFVSSGPYSFLVTFAVLGLAASVGPLALAWLWARFFSPNKPGASKNATYECGIDVEGTGWVQFKADYYLYAIVFLVFDVETIFLLPFAAAFTGLSVGACVAMLIFILLLIESLVWAWGKGVLTWR
jgi:NADH:ubiquinone oxidoreductase subunit 3 (subunit A)